MVCKYLGNNEIVFIDDENIRFVSFVLCFVNAMQWLYEWILAYGSFARYVDDDDDDGDDDDDELK